MQRKNRRSAVIRPKTLAVAVAAAFAQTIWLHSAWAQSQYKAEPAKDALPNANFVNASQGTVTNSGATQTYNQYQSSAIVEARGADGRLGGYVSGADTKLVFNSASATDTTLVRSLYTNIWGNVVSGHRLFFSSSEGVYFAPGASIQVGSLFATSLSITDADFLAGRYNFSRQGNAGAVTNDGRIEIVNVGGYAALAGPQVQNNGVIVAQAGNVTLAAGDRVTLDMVGDGLVKVSVDAAALNALALNSGTIQADGGRVVLTARSANALLDTVINNTGVIRARSLVERNGEIVLDGGGAGVVANGHAIDASGTDAGTAGGTVTVKGQHVYLADGSRIDASGVAGGGTVVVSGSETAYVHGSINAQGTGEGASGGFVETSGHYLEVAQAPNVGAGGTWLIDPYDIEVVAGGGTTNNDGAPTFTPNGDTSQIGNQLINDQLNAGTNVVLDTGGAGSPGTQAGDIRVQAAIDKTVANPASLTLRALHDVEINDSINIASAFGPTGFGTLSIDAGNNVVVSAPITTQGGGLSIRAGGFTNRAAIENGVGGDLKPGMAIFADRFDLAAGTINGGQGSVGLFTRSATNTLGVEAAGDTRISNADIASITTSPDSPFTNANQLLIGVGPAGTMRIGDDAQVNGGSKNLVFSGGFGPGTRITVGANGVTTTGDVVLDGTGGSIAGTGTIGGNRVVLKASTGVGASTARVATAANTLAVNTGGNAFVSEADSVTLDNVALMGSSTTNTVGGTLDFTANGSVTVGGIVFAGSGMNVNVGQDLNVVGSPGRSAILTTNGQQTVTAANISLQAAATGTNGRAIIANTGGTADQTINVAGTLKVTGGDGGLTNSAAIVTNGNQAVNGNAEITLTGGASGTGSVAAQTQNSASIQSNGAGKTQTINAAKITLRAGGGNDTFAGISAANQFITVVGDVDIKGGSGTGLPIARIGGIGTPAGATNLNLSARDVIITGGDAASGEAGLGGTVLGAGPQPNTISISASRDVTLNGGTGGARIGTPLNFATPAAGDISITAGRNIDLKGETNSAAIRTAGNVTLNAGGSITENQANAAITAAKLTTSSLSDTVLIGDNRLGSFGGTATTGSLSLHNVQSLTISGPVSSATSLNLDVDGALTLDASAQDAIVTSHTGQTVTADSIAMNAQAGHRAILQNLGSGDQSVSATAGGLDMNVVGGAGVAQIVNNTGFGGTQTVSAAGTLQIAGGSGSGSTNSGIFLNSGGGGLQSVSAGAIVMEGANHGLANSGALISTGQNDQMVNAAGDITIVGGSVGNTGIFGAAGRSQSVSGHDISLTNTANNANSNNSGAFILGGHQNVNAGGDLTLTGRASGGSLAGVRIGSISGGTDLTVNVGGNVVLTGGTAANNGAGLGSSAAGIAQPNNITITASGDVILNGGDAAGSGVRIGSASNGVASGNISVSARDIRLNGGAGAPAFIRTADGVTLNATGSIGESGNAFVQAGTLLTTSNGATDLGGANLVGTYNGTTGFGGDLTFNNAQDLTVTGGFAGGNLALSTTGAGSDVTIAGNVSSVGSMTLNVSGNLDVTADGPQSSFVSANGGQTINAQSLLVRAQNGGNAQVFNNGGGDQAITIDGGGTGAGIDVIVASTGGSAGIANNAPGGGQVVAVVDADHIALDAANGFANLFSFGNQTVSITGSGANSIRLGSTGALGSSTVGAGLGQSVTAGSAGQAGSISITGPGAQSRLAGFITNSGVGDDTQTISTSGTLTVTGGSAAAQLNNFGTGIFHNRQGLQTINAADIVVRGGTGGSNNTAFISTNPAAPGGTGPGGRDQLINVTGNIDVIGSDTGSNNRALIVANNGNQTINAGGDITIRAGASGVSNTINAGISAQTPGRQQTITAHNIALSGPASGGTDSFASIAGTNQMINATGNVTLTGGASGGTLAGVRIGGFGGAAPTASNITMNIGGDLVLTGGAAGNGVGLGSSAISAQANNIAINAGGSVVLNEGSGSGARIGGAATDPGGGNIAITAGGNIALNGVTQRTAIRTSENVMLSAGGSIIEGANGFVQAGALTTTSTGATNLVGPNQVGAFTGSTFGGDLTPNNSGALNVMSATVFGNVALANAGNVNVSGSVTSTGTMNLDVAGALSVTASPTQDATVTANAGQTIHAHSLAVTAQNGRSASLTNNGVGNQMIDISGGGLGAGIDVQNLGGGIAIIGSNAAGGTQTITVSGGDHVAVRGSSGFAGINSNGGAQSISLTGAAANAIVVGSAGALGTSAISGRGQTVTAGTGSESGSITIVGSVANGTNANMGTLTGSGAVVQSISTSGDLTITGGSAVGVANTGLFHNGTGAQSVHARNIVLQGGTSAGTSGGGAFISNTNGGGDQDILASGSISLTAGGMGQGNRAFIVTNGNQTIHGDPNIVIQGGAGGGGSASLNTSNGAGIVASIAGKQQTIEAASITLKGGGGNDAFAVINGANQLVTVTGDVLLEGGAGTGTPIARLGGIAGAAPGPTNLTLAARDVILTGGAGAGGEAGIGSTILGTPQANSVTVNAARDVILDAGTGGARIGTSPVFATPAGGDISVTAERDIQVNGAATIRTSGNVALNAGGSISETGNGQVVAANLTTTSVGNSTLGGANEVASLTASAGGDVSLRNTAAVLTLGTMDLPGSLSIDQTGALAVPGTVSALNQAIQATGEVAIGGAGVAAAAGLFAPGTISISTPQSIVLRGSDIASGASSVVLADGLVTLNAGEIRLAGGAASYAAAKVLGGDLDLTSSGNTYVLSGTGLRSDALFYSRNDITMTIGGTLTMQGHNETSWARVQTERYDGTIILNFPNAASGSITVDGFGDRFKHGQDGLWTADKPAKLGTTLFINYGL